MEFKTVKIKKPDDANVIIGQSHFIKTVEDLYEVLIGAVPGIKFGLGFCESSGDCLVRTDGNDVDLQKYVKSIKTSKIHIYSTILKYKCQYKK